MQDRDWTGTATAVTALALTAGVWLWSDDVPRPAPTLDSHHGADSRTAEDMARWQAEARRWDGAATPVQLSAAMSGEALVR